jgi:hypothetical protein
VAGDADLSLERLPQAADPLSGHLVIAACSRRKLATTVPVAALDLYQGGCIPWLRSRLGSAPHLRARIRILSAQYGLLNGDRPMLPYDRPLDPRRAAEMLPLVTDALAREWAVDGAPREILVIAEPIYLVPLAAILATPAVVHWVSDPYDTHAAGRVLCRWGWP